MTGKQELMRAALWIFLLLAPVLQCKASFLRLSAVPACTFKENHLTVALSISNEGDEAAHQLVAEVLLGDARGISPLHPVLDAGHSYRTSIDITCPDMDKGIHTVIAKIRCTDRNGYPLTSLTTVPLVTAIPAATGEPIGASFAPATMKHGCTADLTITNRTSEVIETSVRVFLPDELACSASIRRLTIPPRSLHREPIEIRNISALRGSRYSLAAVVDCSSEGLHHSVVASSQAHIKPRTSPLVDHRRLLLGVLLGTIAVAVAGQLRRPASRSLIPPPLTGFANRFFSPSLVLIIAGIVLFHLHPAGILSDTMAVGGDTPAHNYLASQLKTQLIESGRIIGWSPGWWGGFPLFQFYFCLPYLLISILSTILPFNIAFKLVSVSGMLLLPASAFFAARRMRLTFPLPVLLAISTIVLLFDTSHTMWGVNIYSTLAGMIANSLSFAIMLVFVASAARDCDTGRFRVRSVLLFVCLLASHFFTTVIALLTLAVLPFLRPRTGFVRATSVLARECGLGALIMAWWIVPLVAKRPYGVDFGVNWDIDYTKVIGPFMLAAVAPLGIVAIAAALLKRFHGSGTGALTRTGPLEVVLAGVDAATVRFVLMTGFMLVAAVSLFLFGYELSPVFVNVRLWPFMTYGALAMAAAGTSILLRPIRNTRCAVTAVLAAVLLWGTGKPEDVMQWAEWNYDGLEKKARWPVIRELVLPLAGTPGRLANDLNDYNVSLGSSRIFEATPHLTGKPILEGGVVNSALGSLFAYFIQSETSDHYAGLPPIVEPATFNFTNATRHLELLNVKHFIARSEMTRNALTESPDWIFVRESQGWELHELSTHDGNYVFVPAFDPVPVITADSKATGLEWMYRPELLDRFFVLLEERRAIPRRFAADAGVESATGVFDRFPPVASGGKGRAPAVMQAAIHEEEVSARRIRFKTTAIGAPHIIKSCYFPNWKVRGAEGVYMVTPCFMLVYPTEEQVELYYGYVLSDNIGHVLALLGAVLLCIVVIRRRKR